MSRNAVLATTLVMASAAGGWFFYRRSRASQKQADEDDGVEEIPALSRDQVVLFFEKLNAVMTRAFTEAQMQFQQYASQVPEQQLIMLLLQQFEGLLEEEQQKLLDAWDVTEEEVELATKYHAADPAVARNVKLLKQMHGHLSGRPDAVELPPGFNEKKFCAVLDRYFDAGVEAMGMCIKEMEAQGKMIGTKESLVELQALFGVRAQAHLEEALKPFGFTPEMMPSAQQKYQDSPLVQRTATAGQLRQQQGFAQLGIGT